MSTGQRQKLSSKRNDRKFQLDAMSIAGENTPIEQRNSKDSKMTTYTATFADGTTITRKSERAYTAAWRSTWTNNGRNYAFTGFAVSPEKVSPHAPAPFGGGNSANDRAKVKRKNEEFRAECGYRVEVVPAIAA